MQVLNRYLTKDFVTVFLVTLSVFTFVMGIGAVIKAIDYLARGVSGWFFVKFFLLNTPFILIFSVPMSVLTTVLLLFSRLSFDGELTAMRASGLSIWQIISPIILISIVMTFVCIYITSSIAPRSRYAQRQLKVDFEMVDPMDLLDEGRFVKDFPGLMIYVGKKEKKTVYDLVVYEMGQQGVERNVRAKSGTWTFDAENRMLIIDLNNVRIEEPDKSNPMDLSRSLYIPAEHYQMRKDISELMESGKVSKKNSDFTFPDLIRAIRNVRSAYPDLKDEDITKQRMKMVVEANKRLALSVSCFAFTLLGIPLGMKSQRKESSIGIGISLLLAFVFYFFIALAESLVGNPEYRPDLIIWIPVVFAELLGFYLLYRMR